MPKVSVVVLNYNGGSLLGECFKALQRQEFRNFEIIVVDNGSAGDTKDMIEQQLKQNGLIERSKILMLDKNKGFSGGNIAGLMAATGDYVVTLNNDTSAEGPWIDELVSPMENGNEIGICASLLNVHGLHNIDSAGDGFSRALKGFKRGEGKAPVHFDKREHVFGACAGAALYRREMLDDIGFFDEDFFLIYEDTDLNFRAQLAGWKVMYVPTAVVHHKVRSSIGEMSDLAVYYSLRNSELVRIKNVPLGVFLRCLPEFLIGVISEFIYFAIKHKRFRLYFKAKRDALKMFPRMWKKRKEIMKKKKVSNAYIMSIMTPVWQKDFFSSKLRKFLHG